MESKSISVLTRRQFIRQASCAAVGTAALTCAIRDLRFMNAAVAQSNITDYKALVCVFLYGGNDANNMLVPRDASQHAAYASPRGSLALPLDQLLPVASPGGDGREFGLHPSMAALQQLYAQGRAALLCNVGPLVAPITRQDWLARTTAVLIHARPSRR